MPTPATILVVDDHELVRRSLHSLLGQEHHWTVYEAVNGEDALASALKVRPNVVVMDIVMPEMSGIEATYEMRRLLPEVRIILMSSYYTPEEAAHLARLFGDGNFIEKAAIGNELIPVVSRLLAEQSGAIIEERAEAVFT